MPYQFPSPPLDREITTTPSSAIMNIATDWMLRVLRSDTLAVRVAWTLRDRGRGRALDLQRGKDLRMRSEALGHQDLPHAAWVAEVLLVPRQQCIGGPDHSLHFEDLTEPPNLVACPQPRQQLAARLGGRGVRETRRRHAHLHRFP